MKKIFTYLLAVILLSLCSQGIKAQPIGNYLFAPPTTVAFTPLVGSTTFTVNAGGGSLDDGYSSPLTIPFTFTFGGTAFTSLIVTTNGAINFGAAPSGTTYTPLSGTDNNVLAFLARDLNNTGAVYSYLTTGSTPNRIFKMEALNFWRYGAATELGNAQVWLYETSNVIEFHYGTFAAWSAGNTCQVGLRGTSTAVDQIKSLSGVGATAWTAPVAGNLSASTMDLNTLPASGLTYHFSPPPPCVAPVAQPTALVLTPSTVSMNGSFTASGSADSYLVVRSLSSTLSATPVNGTTYVVGAAFGGGIVDYFNTGTSFTSTGLTPFTQYYYFIFAANTFCTGVPPLYLTTSPLTGNQSTLQVFPISGNKTVGPTGDFFTLTAAFAYLNTNGVNGALNLVLQSTYVSSVEPAFPIPALVIPGASAINTVTVYPSATGLSITSASATGTINMNGASYITFDGRVNAAGSTRSLVIENSSTSGYAIQFVNGSTNDGVNYCIVKSANVSLASGTITFGSTTPAIGVGNNNNTISNCEVRDGVTVPAYAIYSAGSTSPILFNRNNTVSNCLIHDFYIPTGGSALGIVLFAGNTSWTITGNSFYSVATLNPTLATQFFVMYIASGDGYTITNNYIGGSAPGCGGTPWTINGNGTPPTIANLFYGIYLTTGVLTVNTSSIQGNTIANITLNTNASASSIYFMGIFCAAGIVNIGNVTPNVIGAATGNGSITINEGLNASGYNPVFEGIDFRGMQGNVMNNTVGSITFNPPAGSASTLYNLCRWISVTPTAQNNNCVVSGNLVGSLTTANSIQISAVTFPPVINQGILVSTTGAGTATMTVSNNTIANMTDLSSHATSYTYGLYDASSTVPIVATGNTIRDLTVSSQNLTIAGAASITGLYSVNSVPGSIIRSNTIYNLSNTEPALAVGVHGMLVNHTAGSLLMEKNFIHHITTASSSASSQVDGIYMACSGAYVTAKNNMIQLGINPNGTANTASSVIIGIYETAATIDSVLNNSIYIGGAPAAGVTGSTYAFNSTITPALTTPRVYLNNIFFNARSGGTTGMHYGIKVVGTTQFPLGLTSNYNLILSNGAVGGVFGSFNAADQLTFAAWKNTVGTDVASGNADPNFVAPTGNTATANLHVQSPTPIEAAGKLVASVTEDYDGQVRSTLTPTDVGADAGNFTLSADVFGPNITYVPIGNGLVAANRVLSNWATITDNMAVSTGASLPRIYYKKSTNANAFVGNTSANNGWKYVVASNSSTPFSFTIDYSLLQAPVAAGDIIQYFVVAQDAANNLSSWYPMAGFSAVPPVQNINAAPTNVQSYTIVTNSIPTIITVPGTYATLTATGGAFDMINQGVLVGNTTINITADLVEPGTVALNAWSEDPPGSNYKLVIQPDASTLRTISGTATLAAGTGLIRTNGASRFTINGKPTKLLTFRFTNTTPGSNQPTIQFNNGSVNDTLKYCTIESNSSTSTYGSVNIGYNTTLANTVVIMNNDIRNATGGTTGLQATGIASSSVLNNIKIVNNNIYNFNNYGCYITGIADGAVISGNSFYYNSALANTAAQYCLYLSSGLNNHTISGNYIGGQAPLCGGSAWTTTTANSLYGIYGSVGVIVPSTISNNTIQNIFLNYAGSSYLYSIYMTGGVMNIMNNLIGSTTVLNSINYGASETGYLYGIYASTSATAASNVQGNIISGINYPNTAASGYLYLLYLTTGLFNVGTTSPNIIGSSTVAGSITYAGTGGIYGLYLPSSNPGNAVENNIIGNWSLTGTAGSPYMRGMYIYSANTKKNKVFNISCTNAGLTPYIYGIYNYGASGVTNEYSNNLVSLNGGAATNPIIYGFYDGSYSTAFFNLYYNDFYVSGPATTTASTYAYYRGVAAFYTLRNNIIANNRASGGTGKHYAAYISSTGVWSSDNNDLYSTAGPLGYYGADQSTLAAWQTATGGDYNSFNVDPQFVSASDLHTAVPALNNTGITISGITTDYAGVTRGNPPDIGAYEFSLSPVVVTVAASGITAVSATLNGTINSGNEVAITGYDYGLTIAYGTSIAGSPVSITSVSASPFTGGAAGLTPNTLYHFRAKGTANAIIYYGGDLTFTTLAIPPTVVTTAATAITSTTVTLNGTVNANNSSTTVSFDYGLTAAYGNNVAGIPVTVNGNIVTAVLANLSGLTPCTLYHFRVKGVNAGGTANGSDLTFTTLPAAPIAVTLPATAITITGATLNGTINANCLSTTVTFDYGLTAAYGTTVPGVPSPVTGNAVTPVSAILSGLLINTTYHFRVCGTNANGSSCGNDMTFATNCPVAGPAGPITGPTQVCQGGCGYVYSVTIPNATGYVWTLPVGGTITSGANTNTITVCFAANSSPGYMFVYGTAPCGNGAPSQLAVAMNPPAAPTLSGPASVCVNSAGNVYTTQSGMSNYVWTVSAGGNITNGGGLANNTVTVTWVTTGAKTVSVNYNTAAGCPALSPTVYNVTVNPLPVPTIAGPSPACSNFPGLVYTTQAGMTGYTWAISAGGSITGGLGTNAITVTWNAIGAQNVSVNYTNANGCTAVAAVVYPVTVNSSAVPTIAGSTTLCVNSGYYNYTTEPGMTGYTWTISAGGVINFGASTNVITASWTASGAQWVRVNYTNPAGCQAYNPTQLNITVNAPPAAAGSITGTATICGGANGVAYSVAAVAGASTYVWTLPAGATIASGANTNSITVNFAANASSGNITVYANNTCGNGAASPPFAITVTPLPAAAGNITGPASVCQGAAGVVYTVPAIAGASTYSWTVPAGAIITGGGTTNSITVDFSPSAVSGNITVLGINSCGNGTVSPNFAVTVNAIPATPVVTNTGTTLYSSAPTGNQWYFEGTLIVGATAQTYVATQDGYYWSIVTLNGCSSAESNHLQIFTTGVDSHSSSAINIYPVPNDGQFTISITSASNESFSISVYNNLGVKIYEETKVEVNGSIQKVIDLRPVPNGVYSVMFENSQKQVVKKIVVNK